MESYGKTVTALHFYKKVWKHGDSAILLWKMTENNDSTTLLWTIMKKS